jgi:hypothetical protein
VTRTLTIVLAMLLVLAPLSARAQFAFTPLNPDNPYAAELTAQRERLVQALQNYTAYYFAYYAGATTLAATWAAYNYYVETYRRNVALRKQYDEAEKNPKPEPTPTPRPTATPLPALADVSGYVRGGPKQEPIYRYLLEPVGGATVQLLTGPSLSPVPPGTVVSQELRVAATTTTRPDGTFKFTDVPAGRYRVSVRAAGWADNDSQLITVGTEDITNVGILLTRPATVANRFYGGIVRAYPQMGNVPVGYVSVLRPVQGARVTLTPAYQVLGDVANTGAARPAIAPFTTTGPDGRFSFENLESGTYFLTIEAANYSTVSRQVVAFQQRPPVDQLPQFVLNYNGPPVPVTYRQSGTVTNQQSPSSGGTIDNPFGQ